MAIFFGIAGGLTAVGPILGGYLTQWTWRAIFWVNIPVALIALVLIAVSKPKTQYKRAPIDYRGAVLIAAGIGLSIFGLQQSVLWSWSNPGTWICIVAGLVIIGLFVLVELHTESPLIKVEIFRIRPFAVENLVLLIAMMAFIPVFFFASEYAQIALRKSASQAGVFLLFFFVGFVVLAQVGGRILDREGAKRAVVLGCAIAAVGFGFWASKATTLSFSKQQIWVIVAGAGMGMMLGPANTDAVNRAGNLSYGEATGHHPDHPELRRQPGPGRARHDPVVRLPLAPHDEPAHRWAIPTQPPRRTASRSPRTGAARCPPSRTSSRSTSRTPPRRCSTSCAASWPLRASSRCSACNEAARRWHRSTRPRCRRRPGPTEPPGSEAAPAAGPGREPARVGSTCTEAALS